MAVRDSAMDFMVREMEERLYERAQRELQAEAENAIQFGSRMPTPQQKNVAMVNRMKEYKIKYGITREKLPIYTIDEMRDKIDRLSSSGVQPSSEPIKAEDIYYIETASLMEHKPFERLLEELNNETRKV